MFGTIYGGGSLYAYVASRPFKCLATKLIVFHGGAHLFMVAAAMTSFVVMPYRRLTGFWDNGTRWRVPEDKLQKYDVTSHHEKATGWSKYRINTGA